MFELTMIFVADIKVLQLTTRIAGGNSNYPCPLCTWHKSMPFSQRAGKKYLSEYFEGNSRRKFSKDGKCTNLQ